MLHLYQSDKLESLAARFAAAVSAVPLENPFAPEEIVVQSQGMRRYLNAYLARETGVAANLKFSLPAGLAWRLMQDFIDGIPEINPFSAEVLRWRLVQLFGTPEFQTAPALAPVRTALADYLNGSATAAYQLAGELADIFDQYLVYRPEWIDAWQAGRLLDLGRDEIWQAALWRFLDDGSQTAPHRVALWEMLLGRLKREKLPERLFVFGISTMAPMYLQLLQALAEHCDVVVFALNPSAEYWGNVIEPAQILKNGGSEADSGHPLLASLGKQGRDFFDALTETEIGHNVQIYAEDDGNDTLLHRLQHDIRRLKTPQTPDYPVIGFDQSVHIVSAHSPLRELQVLKDRLLGILAEHPDWQPHDIAVLTPDIEPYAPFIEAVFGQSQGGAQALPYSVSDVRLSRRQPLFYALEQLLDALESRFEVDKILPLLEHGLILERFGLTRDDLPLLRDAAAALNVRWGLDETARGGNALFTWRQALDRMVLGWMLPDDGALWQGVGAWQADFNQTGTLARFAAFVHALARTANEWRCDTDTEGWCARVHSLLAGFFHTDGEPQAVQQLGQALAQWRQQADAAGFGGTLPYPVAVRHIRRFLGSESEAGFLRGGITFCSMVPMRSLPFKVICLLGLNDGRFPRDTRASSFDLIARHPKKGDRARRDDDRYLFLEALVSAREILYLSYIGRSVRNDEPLAPSSLLGELIDTLAGMTGMPSEKVFEQHVVRHPLQAFSRRYFDGSGFSDGLRSSRSDYAQALNTPAAAPEPFFSEPLAAADETAVHNEIDAQDFLAFWRSPVRAWLRQALGWSRPYFGETADSAEPFEPDAGQTAAVSAAYTEARRRREDFRTTEQRISARSLLPAGEIGALWQQRFQTAAKQLDGGLLDSPELPPAAFRIATPHGTLAGSITRLHKHGRIIVRHSNKKSAPETTVQMLEHLIYCAARPSETPDCTTHILGQETATYPPVRQETAADLLGKWLQYYRIGQSRPLPFFPKTALAAAAEFNKKQDWQAALKAAYKAYEGGKMATGEKDYAENAQVFGRDDESPLNGALFENMVRELLSPLLAVCGVSDKDVADKPET
ncbi:exodeoxyribonuclease V subunit gamma [Neisseria sp.]|uniref:exodeoxyribonuclease V subunit gamma n=1 Tax=Neisseria sp. TaxID=192066 RepID=UPI0035A16F6F